VPRTAKTPRSVARQGNRRRASFGRAGVFGIFAVLLMIAVAWTIIGIPGNLTAGKEVRIFIRRGAPFREAADSLAARGVITSSRLFGIYARLRGADRSLRFGTYVLRDAMSWEQVLSALRLGRGVVHSVTIPEGWTIAEMAPALGEALDIPAESVFAAVRDTALLHRFNIPTPTLEGYLFPDTYTFPDRFTARQAVKMMVERFEQEWKPEYDSLARELRLNRHDIVTLASIVEKEVRKREEGPVVAAVYLNRLRIRMPLQADPTIDYALGRKPGRVLFKDLRVDSPYNTYRFPGLPPGPIGAPGASSIAASLRPAKVNFRYFVAHPDGHHEFRRTYEEHLAAIRMVRTRPAGGDSATTKTTKKAP
jgi:UPF0755 protein